MKSTLLPPSYQISIHSVKQLVFCCLGHVRLMHHGGMVSNWLGQWRKITKDILSINTFSNLYCNVLFRRQVIMRSVWNKKCKLQSPVSVKHKWSGLGPEVQAKDRTTQRRIPESHIQLSHHPLHWVRSFIHSQFNYPTFWRRQRRTTQQGWGGPSISEVRKLAKWR